MWLKFTKMHGAGNDFVVIDGISARVRLSPSKVRKIADRHFGVGCDQLLLVEAPAKPDVDFTYRIYNHDGSEVEQCGNGARCFAKFVRDKKLTAKRNIRVTTKSGDIELDVNQNGTIRVNMGEPRLEPSDIPLLATNIALEYEFNVANESYWLSAVSMGNPHGILFVDSVDNAPVLELGPQLEAHEKFPNRANISFLEIISRTEAKLRVFERGVGETLACGTGACAAVVAGIRAGKLDNKVNIELPGGALCIDWQGEGHPVMMDGPAKTVFQGQLRI